MESEGWYWPLIKFRYRLLIHCYRVGGGPKIYCKLLLEGDFLIPKFSGLFSPFFCVSNFLTTLPLKERFLYNRKPSEKTKQKSPGLSGTFTQTKKRTHSFRIFLFTPCLTSTWVRCVPGGRTRNSLPCGNCHRKSECKSVHRPYQGFFCWRHHQSRKCK